VFSTVKHIHFSICSSIKVVITLITEFYLLLQLTVLYQSASQCFDVVGWQQKGVWPTVKSWAV